MKQNKYLSVSTAVECQALLKRIIAAVADCLDHPMGAFVTVWQSNGQDGSGWGIFGEVGPIVGSADFSDDGFVDFRDYCIMAGERLKVENPLRADLVNDNQIDEWDLSAFCEQWLMDYSR